MRQPYHRPSEGADVTEALLLALQQACAGDGAQLLVLLIPDSAIVRPLPQPADDTWLAYLGKYRAAREMCQNAGLPFVDTLDPLLEAARQGARLYYARDGHWTAEGHAIGARELRREIEKQQLLPAQCLD